jgi:hypothetical protein
MNQIYDKETCVGQGIGVSSQRSMVIEQLFLAKTVMNDSLW